jgi:cell division protein FtsW (lipid II flippase)
LQQFKKRSIIIKYLKGDVKVMKKLCTTVLFTFFILITTSVVYATSNSKNIQYYNALVENQNTNLSNSNVIYIILLISLIGLFVAIIRVKTHKFEDKYDK